MRSSYLWIALLGFQLLASGPSLGQTASLLPNGEQTFLDLNGQPLASGSVYFDIPSTTTPKTTWVDPNQSVQNSNPVVLDSAGRAIIYGSGQYREIVKDQFGDTIWDQLTNSGPCFTQGTTSTSCAAGNDSRFGLQTRQVFTATGAATYTTPANVRQLYVREIGGFGGGGGGGTGSDGGPGVASSFNSITANGGSVGKGNGTASAQSGNGTGGTSPTTSRYIGAGGPSGQTATSATGAEPGEGGSSPLGGQAGNGGSEGVNSGQNSGGAGGSPEYVEILINSPGASYSLVVGTGGAGGAGGSGASGTAGSPGEIVVDERY